jgi:hypothetical protein
MRRTRIQLVAVDILAVKVIFSRFSSLLLKLVQLRKVELSKMSADNIGAAQHAVPCLAVPPEHERHNAWGNV